MSDPFDAFPQTLDLISAVVPRETSYVTTRGSRLFVTVVEYWNTRTTLRYVLPVSVLVQPEHMTAPSITDDDGTEYGFSGGGGGGGSLSWDAHLSTEIPVPQHVKRLHVVTGDGQDFVLDI